jgi:hypothetical protein
MRGLSTFPHRPVATLHYIAGESVESPPTVGAASITRSTQCDRGVIAVQSP